METKEELIERIIKEQDLVCFYTAYPYDKAIDFNEKYSKDNNVEYTQLRNFILSNPQIIDRLSTKNLMTLLSATNNEDMQKQLVEKVSNRLKNENLFLEDIDRDAFMRMVHSTDLAINKLEQKDVDLINSKIRERMKNIIGTNLENTARHINYISSATNFLEYFEQGIFNNEKIALLERMIQKDKNTLRYVNFGIFKDDIFNIGEEFIEYVSKFPRISTQLVIISNHNPKLIKVLSEQISNYEILEDKIDEIEILITYFAKKCFEIDLSKNINIEDLIESALKSSISLNPRRRYNPVNVQEGENYQERLQKEYEKQYNLSITIEDKRNLYLDKVFSLTESSARNFIKEYGTDIENIEGLKEEEKELIYKLKEALNIKDEAQIDEMFNRTENLYKPSQVYKIRQNIAKECAKSYVNEMKNTDNYINGIKQKNGEYIEYNGKKIPQIKLIGNFNMLLHSTDTNFISKAQEINPETNFVQLWNSGEDKENHIISTTLLNQDFMGTSPVGQNGVRYAFTNIPQSSIKLMGVTDINTYSTEFAYNSAQKQYMSAKTLPYNSRRVYSEFGIEREGTIPNYVVVFDDDIEDVKNNSYKAAEQFNIPVLFIDKREIEQQQIRKLNSLIKKCEEEKNVADLKNLINIYETNRAGWLLNRIKDEPDESYTSSIDNSRFEKDFDNIADKIETTVKDYLDSVKSNKSNHDVQELTHIMGILLNEIDLYKECAQVAPISKTSISFNAYGLIEETNNMLKEVGESEYMVDMENLPSLDEYELTMKQIVVNALKGENFVDIEDVNKAIQVMDLLQERGELQNDR